MCGSFRVPSRHTGRCLLSLLVFWCWRSASDTSAGFALPSSGARRAREALLPSGYDIADRPANRMVGEMSRYEDPRKPFRPDPGPRNRRGKWAPPGPELIEPPEVLVIGFGRQLRESDVQGPRARLGAAAVEVLQMRHDVGIYFDAEVGAYMGQARASLDKSGKAGVQKINFLQPVTENDNELGPAMWKTMQREGMDGALVLCVLSDWRLPFGQIRLSPHYDDSDARLRSAYAALGQDRRVVTLRIGCGRKAASAPLDDQEARTLPDVLNNAATAIELWLSEADTGLVMRFVNRPAAYALPEVTSSSQNAAAASERKELESAELETVILDEGEPNVGDTVDEALTLYNEGDFRASAGYEPAFVLFDLNREDPTELPEMLVGRLPVALALATLGARPVQSEAVLVAGRRFESLAALQADLVSLVLEVPAGMHLRLQNDEDLVRAMISYHPDAARLLEDLVALKVDCSPIDDDTRCYWVVKYDGYEEEVDLRECLMGLQSQMALKPAARPRKQLQRLGPGSWRKPSTESLWHRSHVRELAALSGSK